MNFNPGDLVVFNPGVGGRRAAKPGALAVVTKPRHTDGEVSYITVKWICGLSGSQMNGDYFERDFILADMGNKNNEDFL